MQTLIMHYFNVYLSPGIKFKEDTQALYDQAASLIERGVVHQIPLLAGVCFINLVFVPSMTNGSPSDDLLF